jgi:hypothetical protein
MSAGHPLVAFDIAVSRREELLHQAEERRIVAIADATRSPFATGLRGHLGRLLVGLGERLQSRPHPLVGDLATATGPLRISR